MSLTQLKDNWPNAILVLPTMCVNLYYIFTNNLLHAYGTLNNDVYRNPTSILLNKTKLMYCALKLKLINLIITYWSWLN